MFVGMFFLLALVVLIGLYIYFELKVRRVMRQDPVQIAARWWAERLRRPAAHHTGSESGLWLTIAAGREEGIVDAAIARFEKCLARQIAESIVINRFYPDLKVDYCPEDLLVKAAEQAEIKVSLNLPSKTLMLIRPDRVEVACGYQSEFETLWSKAA